MYLTKPIQYRGRGWRGKMSSQGWLSDCTRTLLPPPSCGASVIERALNQTPRWQWLLGGGFRFQIEKFVEKSYVLKSIKLLFRGEIKGTTFIRHKKPTFCRRKSEKVTQRDDLSSLCWVLCISSSIFPMSREHRNIVIYYGRVCVCVCVCVQCPKALWSFNAQPVTFKVQAQNNFFAMFTTIPCP